MSLPAGMCTSWTKSKSFTEIFCALPPFTETVAVHPESQATDRTTVDGAGACTRICSDFVVLEMVWTGRRRPFPVEAAMGSDGLRKGEDRIALGEATQLPRSRHQRRRQGASQLVGLSGHRHDGPLLRERAGDNLHGQADGGAPRMGSGGGERNPRGPAMRRPNASSHRPAAPRSGRRVPGPAG